MKSRLHNPVAMTLSFGQARAELDPARVEFLFQFYEQLTAPLLPTVKKKRRA